MEVTIIYLSQIYNNNTLRKFVRETTSGGGLSLLSAMLVRALVTRCKHLFSYLCRNWSSVALYNWTMKGAEGRVHLRLREK